MKNNDVNSFSNYENKALKVKSWQDEKIFEAIEKERFQKSNYYFIYVKELGARATTAIYEKAYALTHTSKTNEKITGIKILKELGLRNSVYQSNILTRFFEILSEAKNNLLLKELFNGIRYYTEFVTENQLTKLLSYKNSPKLEIRKHVLHTLTEMEHPKAINTLIEFTEDIHKPIQEEAIYALAVLSKVNNKIVTDALWNKTKDTSRYIRFRAIIGLAYRKQPKVKPLIIEELNYRKNKTPLSSILIEEEELLQALIILNDKDFIPYLENWLTAQQGVKVPKEKLVTLLTNGLRILKQNTSGNSLKRFLKRIFN